MKDYSRSELDENRRDADSCRHKPDKQENVFIK